MLVGSLVRVIERGARWRSAGENKPAPSRVFLIQTSCGGALRTLILGPGKGLRMSIAPTFRVRISTEGSVLAEHVSWTV
jgi:hypothetical protein